MPPPSLSHIPHNPYPSLAHSCNKPVWEAKKGEKQLSVSWISHTAQAASGQSSLNKQQWIKTLLMGLVHSWAHLKCIISLTFGCKELYRPTDAFLLFPGAYKLRLLVATQHVAITSLRTPEKPILGCNNLFVRDFGASLGTGSVRAAASVFFTREAEVTPGGSHYTPRTPDLCVLPPLVR